MVSDAAFRVWRDTMLGIEEDLDASARELAAILDALAITLEGRWSSEAVYTKAVKKWERKWLSTSNF